MKRLCCVLLLAALSGGCLPLRPRQEVPPPAPPMPARPSAPVSAEQINPNNAHEQCEALQQELEHARNRPCPQDQGCPECSRGQR